MRRVPSNPLDSSQNALIGARHGDRMHRAWVCDNLRHPLQAEEDMVDPAKIAAILGRLQKGAPGAAEGAETFAALQRMMAIPPVPGRAARRP